MICFSDGLTPPRGLSRGAERGLVRDSGEEVPLSRKDLSSSSSLIMELSPTGPRQEVLSAKFLALPNTSTKYLTRSPVSLVSGLAVCLLSSSIKCWVVAMNLRTDRLISKTDQGYITTNKI